MRTIFLRYLANMFGIVAIYRIKAGHLAENGVQRRQYDGFGRNALDLSKHIPKMLRTQDAYLGIARGEWFQICANNALSARR